MAARTSCRLAPAASISSSVASRITVQRATPAGMGCGDGRRHCCSANRTGWQSAVRIANGQTGRRGHDGIGRDRAASPGRKASPRGPYGPDARSRRPVGRDVKRARNAFAVHCHDGGFGPMTRRRSSAPRKCPRTRSTAPGEEAMPHLAQNGRGDGSRGWRQGAVMGGGFRPPEGQVRAESPRRRCKRPAGKRAERLKRRCPISSGCVNRLCAAMC